MTTRPTTRDPVAVRVGHVLNRDPSAFRDDFRDWLRDNWHIFKAVKYKADQLRERGLRNYSMRTIVEVLRWETNLSEANDSDWKINNNYAPDLARLYNMLEPDNDGFFRLRSQDERKRHHASKTTSNVRSHAVTS